MKRLAVLLGGVSAGFMFLLGCGSDFGLGLQTGPPQASFTYTLPDGDVYNGTPLSVNVDASGSTASYERTITSYQWDFDYDGTTPNFTATGVTANGIYNAPGTYTILLRVTDDQGDSDDAVQTVTIQPGVGYVVADITASPSTACIGRNSATDDVVDFDASGSQAGVGDSLDTFDWDFGDTNTASTTYPTTSVTHTYTAAGNYTAQVTVTTTGGGSDTATVDVKVVELTAAFTAPASSAPGVTVNVDASSCTANNTTISSYSWDWGDGSQAGSGVTASHQYTAEGTYTITLTITDENGFTDTATSQITIANLAAVIYAANSTGTPADVSTLTLQTGENGLFTDENSVGTITSYAWQWNWTDGNGDGVPDDTDFTADETYTTAHTAASPLTHSYATAGTYTAVLQVSDGSSTAYDTVTITVTVPPLQANMFVDLAASTDVNADPNANTYSTYDIGSYPYVYYAEADLSSGGVDVTFDASPSTGDIQAFTFSWGDGTAETIINPPTTTTTHTFTQEGIYEVYLDAVDSTSSHDYATVIVTIVDTSQGHSYVSHLLDNPGDYSDQDSSVRENDPTGDYSGNHTHVDSYSGETSYLLFQTDPSSYFTGPVVRGGIVLFCYRENGASGEAFHVYKANAAWQEDTVNWDNHPGYDTTTDYVDGGSGLVIKDLAGTGNDERPNHPYFIPITSLLEDWRTNTSGNVGAYIVADQSVDLSFMSDGYQGNARNPIIIGIQ